MEQQDILFPKDCNEDGLRACTVDKKNSFGADFGPADA